jgi:hypothetical protein
MLKEMHGNTKLEVAPIDDYKLLNKINEVIHKGFSFGKLQRQSDYWINSWNYHK